MNHVCPVRVCAVLLCILTSASAFAQASAFADSSVTRRERLLEAMRAPEQVGILPRTAEEPAWTTKCALALRYSVAKHNERLLSTPVFCEASRGQVTVGVDSDGFVANDGSSNARGVADFNLGGRLETALGTSGLTLSGGLTWPSQSDVGSDHSDAYLGLTLAPASVAKFEPSLEYTIQRNGDPQGAGGRSTQTVGAGLEYPWSKATVSALQWSRTKPRQDGGRNVLGLSHRFDIVPSIGLTGRLSASRSQEEWGAAVSVRIRKTF